MSAYCHAGVTCESFNTSTYPVICVSKNYEFKIDADLDLPCGLMMSPDPERPEYVVPFTGEDGQEVCAILADDVNTEHLACAVTHAIAVKGQFRYNGLLWPESLDTYEERRAVMNQLLDKGICILHDPC